MREAREKGVEAPGWAGRPGVRRVMSSEVRVPIIPWLLDQVSLEDCSTFGFGQLHH